MSHDSMVNVLRALRPGGLTVHGFRACFKTWCSEKTNFPSELAELSLAHRIGGVVERSYRRGDLLEKRRALMEAWAAYCAEPVEDSKVKKLRA